VNLQASASPRWIHAVHGSLRSHLFKSVHWRTGCGNLNLRRRHSLHETGMRFRFLTWRLLPDVPFEMFVSSESRRSNDCAAGGGSSRSSFLLDIVTRNNSHTRKRGEFKQEVLWRKTSADPKRAKKLGSLTPFQTDA
jgi:hypothetical protein